MRIRIHGNVLANVFTQAIAPETRLPEGLPGNVFTERLTQESVNQAVATGTWVPSLYNLKTVV
jgi:hypothetical protein